MLCIQSNPKKFAIAQLSWDDCYCNHTAINGQFNLNRGVPVKTWISKKDTKFLELNQEKLDIRSLIEKVL